MSKLSYASSAKIENFDRFPNRNQYSIKNLEQELIHYFNKYNSDFAIFKRWIQHTVIKHEPIILKISLKCL